MISRPSNVHDKFAKVDQNRFLKLFFSVGSVAQQGLVFLYCLTNSPLKLGHDILL